MMLYSVSIHPKALKYYTSLNRKSRQRIKQALLRLKEDSRPSASTKLTGTHNQWRLRVGDYRILYEIDDTRKAVTVYRIRHRKDSYR